MSGATGLDFKVSWNSVDITGLVLDPTAFTKDGVFEDTTPYGVQDQQQSYAGMRKLPDMPIGGKYDDTPTTGSDAVFDQVGTSAPLVLTWRSGKTSTLTGAIKSYSRPTAVGKVTRFKATLALSGPVVEA